MGQDGRLITTPPRLNGVGIKTQIFRRIVEPCIWNYLVENDTEGKDSIGVPENNAGTRAQLAFLLAYN